MPDNQDMPMDPQIRVKGNHIFFYDQIDQTTSVALNDILHELERDAEWRSLMYGSEGNIIYLHVNSYGGSVFDSLCVADTMRGLKSKVYTIIEGAAMSGATIIALAGDKRFMRKNATVLIHQARQAENRTLTAEEIKDLSKNNERTEKLLADIYEENTSMKREEILELMKHDLYLNSEQCLEYGIVEEIL